MRERKQGVSKLEFLSRLVAIGGVFLAACGPDSEEVKATVFAEIAQTPTATSPATPDVQAAIEVAFAERDRQETEQAGRKTQVALDEIAATLTAAPTATASPSPTATLSAEQALAKEQQPISDYLASRNGLSDEKQEYAQVDLDRFKDYFSTRYLAQADGKEVYAVDLMFAQLAQPVKDLKDRGANFHRRNDGQGLGFIEEDLSVLTDFGILSDRGQKVPNEIFMQGSDGYKRSWAIGEAKDFEGAVLAFVDGWLASNLINPQSPLAQIQGLRRSTFERIIFGDWGVRPWNDNDGDWKTIDDRFDVCTTFAAQAASRDKQPERVRHTHFDPQLEKLDGVEQESVFRLDSRDSILMSAVIDKDGYLRVEVHTLSNPPDVLHGYPNYINDGMVDAHGARWFPCGPGIIPLTATPSRAVIIEFSPTPPIGTPGVPSTPEKLPETPKPPETPNPSPVPTNEHRDDQPSNDEGERDDENGRPTQAP